MQPGFVSTATGSVLIACGETRVICTASVQESVPRWMAGRGRGWVTAEYGMLPASTGDRKARDVTKGRPDGRTVEIQRLIGRSPARRRRLRGARRAHRLRRLRRADGRRRHALRVDHRRLRRARAGAAAAGGRGQARRRSRSPARSPRCRAGSSDGTPLLDLDYAEDSTAEVDANVVMTGEGGLVEVQATAERTPLSRAHLDELLALAQHGIDGPARRAGGGHRLGGAHAAGARHPQRPQGARARAHDGRGADRPAAARTSRSRPRTATRSPPTRWARRGPRRRRSAARRSPTTRASRRPRSAARPAIFSARFAGPDATDADNLAKLRAEAPAGSALRYVCVMAYAAPGGEERTFTGVCDGTLAAERARQRAASATTRRSCPRTWPTAARWPSSPTRRRTRSPTAAAPPASCWRGSARGEGRA